MSAPRPGLSSLCDHEALRGVAIGACVSEQPWNITDVAHVHYEGKRKGWICIQWLRDYNATTIRHELAHLVRGTAGHDEAWRRAVRELGGRVERRYRKR